MSYFYYNDFILFCLLIALFFFIYGAIGVLSEKNNLLRILFFFEVLILIVSFMFIIIGIHYEDLYSQVVVMYLLTIAAVEASIGLALIYVYYRFFGNVKLQSLEKIKG